VTLACKGGRHSSSPWSFALVGGMFLGVRGAETWGAVAQLHLHSWVPNFHGEKNQQPLIQAGWETFKVGLDPTQVGSQAQRNPAQISWSQKTLRMSEQEEVSTVIFSGTCVCYAAKAD
jgi:hypothetical protein